MTPDEARTKQEIVAFNLKTFDMTLQEIADLGFKEVHVLSYGYESAGLFSHYEPFGNSVRELIFSIHKWSDGDIDLDHKWLFFINQNNEDFSIKDGKVYCNDPELKEYPNNDY